jgi:hypothetical protein
MTELTKSQRKAVLKVIGRRWADLAVRHAGQNCPLNVAYPLSFYRTEAVRRRRITQDNAERRELSGAIRAISGKDLPEVPVDTFMVPFSPPPAQNPSNDRYARVRGKPHYDRHRAIKAKEQLALAVAALA